MLARFFTFGMLFLGATLALASQPASLAQILQAETPPEGVVFEIVTGDEDGLAWAIPQVQAAITKLRQRFPDLPVAVVSHGEEMFGLETGVRDSYRNVHTAVQSLLGDNVTVHACGTFAGWRGLSEEDFPAYVDVSASGPAQINDYLALEYVRLIVSDE